MPPYGGQLFEDPPSVQCRVSFAKIAGGEPRGAERLCFSACQCECAGLQGLQPHFNRTNRNYSLQRKWMWPTQRNSNLQVEHPAKRRCTEESHIELGVTAWSLGNLVVRERDEVGSRLRRLRALKASLDFWHWLACLSCFVLHYTRSHKGSFYRLCLACFVISF